MTETSTYKPTGPTITSPHNQHVKALADAFEILFSGSGEARTLIEKRIPRDLTIEHYDGKIYNARELLLSEGIAATPLVQIQYFNTVMEGARLVQCARGAFRTENMTKGNTIRLPFQSTRTGRAPEVPEASPYRNSNATYTYRDFTIKKYGEVAPITDEMISDSLYNTMALEVASLGEHCENSLNYEMIGVVLENSGSVEPIAESLDIVRKGGRVMWAGGGIRGGIVSPGGRSGRGGRVSWSQACHGLLGLAWMARMRSSELNA